MVALALVAAPSYADEAPVEAPEDESIFADRFAGSSILLEHSGSVGHGGDLSPSATFAVVQTWAFSLSFDATDDVSLSAGLGLIGELTPNDTTFDGEFLLDDLLVAVTGSLPMPAEVEDLLGVSLGVAAGLPTSKASQSATLILSLEPNLSAWFTAPLLDGLTFGYSMGAQPRFHRYSTASTRTPYPCSPAAGCVTGTTVDTGVRNPAFQLRVGGDLSLAFWKERLSVSAGLEGLWAWPYPLSPSPNYDEETLANPGIHDDSPASSYTSFYAQVGVQAHPGLGLAIGVWTPSHMRPDGEYRNPFGNRLTTVYIDLVFTPVAGVLHEVRKAKKASGG